MRYTRMQPGPRYLASVVVLITELCKLLLCSCIVLIESGGRDLRLVCTRDAFKLCVPALCYTIQNNLLFLAISNLSAAASQVIYQSKTLSTALFSVLLLKRRFSPCQWLSFIALGLGVTLVQSQDTSARSPSEGSNALVGVLASLAAAALSGFAGVYLEFMFNKGQASLWVRNVQLTLFTIPLQTLTVIQNDLHDVRRHGALVGFHPSTWGVIAVQVVPPPPLGACIQTHMYTHIYHPTCHSITHTSRALRAPHYPPPPPNPTQPHSAPPKPTQPHPTPTPTGCRRDHRRSGDQVCGQHPQDVRLGARHPLHVLHLHASLRSTSDRTLLVGRRNRLHLDLDLLEASR